MIIALVFQFNTELCLNSFLSIKVKLAMFNQERAVVGAFFVILHNFKLRESSFEALTVVSLCVVYRVCPLPRAAAPPRYVLQSTVRLIQNSHELDILPRAFILTPLFSTPPCPDQHSLIVTYQYVGPVQEE